MPVVSCVGPATQLDQCMKDHNPFDWNQSYSGDVADYAEPDPLMLGIIDGLRPGRALDIGCGAGGIIVALARRGWQVTGIDLATKAIEAARKIVQARGIDAQLFVADATIWRPDGHYDLITSSFALPGSKPERASVFQMVRKALAPGGTVLLKDFDSTMNRVTFFAEYDLVTVEELTAAFDGLNIIRVEIVETPVHDHGSEGRQLGERWTAALLHARSP